MRLPAAWNRWRLRDGVTGSDPSDGCNGFFVIPLRGQTINVMVSDGKGWEAAGFIGEAWEHASISLGHRCPTWEEMEWVRRELWSEDDTVIQIHPPLSQYVNFHPHVLHLWRPTKTAIPLPPRRTIAP